MNSQPIIKKFSIFGLNSYKDISISFESDIKVIVAENGTGKTTLLNCLNLFLSQKFNALSKFSFDRMELHLSDEAPIVVRKSDLEGNVSIERTQNYDIFLESGLDPEEIVEGVLLSSNSTFSEFRNTRYFRLVYQYGPWDHADTFNKFKELIDGVTPQNPVLQEATSLIKSKLGGIGVMYLPTYRRIEAQIPKFQGTNRRGVPSRVRRGKKSVADWGAGDTLNFGLNDVERRLKEITVDIKQRTASAYSSISGKTLEQLLESGDINEKLGNELNIQNLRVILARLGKSNLEARLADLIESGRINDHSNRYLKSFLGQMVEIYTQTETQEMAIERFVDLVESYWVENIEEKHLTYNKLDVDVELHNVFTKEELSLNDLSSGEQQIISIFARLYLNPRDKYIILIDEPELSLSIEWQRKFLVDIASSPSCSQLLAITHSPYIFDNVLDKFAGSLELSIHFPDEEYNE